MVETFTKKEQAWEIAELGGNREVGVNGSVLQVYT